MKLFVSIVQVLFALHTALGGVWKLLNPGALTQMFPMLSEGIIMSISVIELAAAALLLLPFVIKPLRGYGWMGAAFVTLEMLAFTGLYLSTGTANYSPMYYWVVVAVVGAFIVYMRRNNRARTQITQQ